MSWVHKIHTCNSIAILSYDFVLRCFGNIFQSHDDIFFTNLVWSCLKDLSRHAFVGQIRSCLEDRRRHVFVINIPLMHVKMPFDNHLRDVLIDDYLSDIPFDNYFRDAPFGSCFRDAPFCGHLV